MNEVVPFSYTAAGNLIVMGDGPELLVYSGSNDQGMWRVMCDDIVMGVGSTRDHVYAVDGSGVLTLYRAINGEPLSVLHTDCSPWTMQVSPEGSAVIVTANSVVIVRGGSDPMHVPLTGPRKVCWGPGDMHILVGCNDGSVYLIEASTGVVAGAVNVGQAVVAVRWRNQGQWVVAHGSSVSYVVGDAELTVTETMAIEGTLTDIAVSTDGGVLAVALSDQRVLLYELLTKGEAGFIEFARDIYGVHFGPECWLAVGFDDGDCNRFDVVNGKMTRTQAHPGRGQNAWKMKPDVNHSVIRGARVKIAAGSSAIAKHNVPKGMKKKKKRGWLIGGLLVGGLALVMVVCCGGGGMFSLWKYGY